MSTGVRRADTWLLQLVAVTSTLDRFAIAPMLVAIAADFAVPLTQVVPAATAYFLAYGLLQPVWGIISDHRGRVATMRLALGLAAACGLASALAPSVALLAVARALAGACFAAAIPTTLVYVGDAVPAARRHGAVTDIMTGVAAGTALASLGAGFVAQELSWRWAFGLTAAVAAVLCGVLRYLPEPPREPAAPALAGIRLVLTRPWPLLVLGIGFAEGFILLGLFTFIPAALEYSGSSTGVAGAVAGSYGLAVLVFARVVKRLSATQPAARLIAFGGSCAIAGFGLLAARQSVPVVLLACLVLGAAWAFLHSSIQTWATSVAPRARATAVSFFAAALFAGSSGGAAAGGMLAGGAAYRELFGLGAVLAVPLLVVAWAGRLRYQP